MSVLSLAPLSPMPKSPIRTSLNQFAWLKRFLDFSVPTPWQWASEASLSTYNPNKPQKRRSRPPQTNTLWAKPLIRALGPWNYPDFAHMESMRTGQLGEVYTEWFFSMWPQRAGALKQCQSASPLPGSTSEWGSKGRCSGYQPQPRPARDKAYTNTNEWKKRPRTCAYSQTQLIHHEIGAKSSLDFIAYNLLFSGLNFEIGYVEANYWTQKDW